jgi:hypothetical protein
MWIVKGKAAVYLDGAAPVEVGARRAARAAQTILGISKR